MTCRECEYSVYQPDGFFCRKEIGDMDSICLQRQTLRQIMLLTHIMIDNSDRLNAYFNKVENDLDEGEEWKR